MTTQRVLIVDDDKFTRSVLQTAFAQDPAFADLDVETHLAANGREAVEAWARWRPDLIWMDMKICCCPRGMLLMCKI